MKTVWRLRFFEEVELANVKRKGKASTGEEETSSTNNPFLLSC